MKSMRRYTLLLAVFLAVAAVAAATAVLSLGTARAQTDTPETEESLQQENIPQRQIDVIGVGVVSAQPDQAVVTFGVETQADSAAEALDENNTLMQEVISATVEFGLSENNIQTQQIRLEPIYQQTQDTAAPSTITGYRAVNSVMVTVEEVDQLGELLDTAIEAGANTIQGIRFEISNREELAAEAREQAVIEAREKAEQLAELTGAELGPVLTISESGTIEPPQPFFAEDVAATGGAVPISPGMQTVEARVQISWALE